MVMTGQAVSLCCCAQTVSSSRYAFTFLSFSLRVIIDEWFTLTDQYFEMHPLQIEPDFIEYFYDELTPMTHYVPASLDNLTDVVMHVMDKDNEVEMKRIVLAANSWCRRKMNAKQIALDMMQQLRKYDT